MNTQPARDQINWAWDELTDAKQYLPTMEGLPVNFTGALYHVRQAMRILEEAQREMVWQARRDGHLWSNIADALGISKQAAQQRYGND